MLMMILYFKMAAEILQMHISYKTEAYLCIIFENVHDIHEIVHQIQGTDILDNIYRD